MNDKAVLLQDRRLDILVLGPMTGQDEQESTCAIIGAALRNILEEPQAVTLLTRNGVTEKHVHIPEGFDESEIVNGVLSKLDLADFVIVNVTPKAGIGAETSPNVMYELALIHAIGLPCILVAQTGSKIPFYVNTTRQYFVPEFTGANVVKALRGPMLKFLDMEDRTRFTDNRVTQFFDDLPIIDISAAVGLATGYYYNFVGRLLKEGSFVTTYPDKVKSLVIVRPHDIFENYESEKARMTGILGEAGIKLTTEKLDEPPSDRKGPAWIDHVNGIVVDLPRMIYPLKVSPRLLAMQERFDKPGLKMVDERERNMVMRQTSERLLDRIKFAIQYHARKQRENYRYNALHFSTMEQLPTLLRELGA
jgi:hypothetical protein